MIYRRYSVPSVMEEFERMQREVNQLMNAFTPARPAAAFPAMNAWTTEEEELVTAELPGVAPEEIDISVVGDVLTIACKRNGDETGEVRYHRRERMRGEFTRSIQLAFPVDVERVSASYENGVLRVTLPRAEADKPRKIAVNAR